MLGKGKVGVSSRLGAMDVGIMDACVVYRRTGLGQSQSQGPDCNRVRSGLGQGLSRMVLYLHQNASLVPIA